MTALASMIELRPAPSVELGRALEVLLDWYEAWSVALSDPIADETAGMPGSCGPSGKVRASGPGSPQRPVMSDAKTSRRARIEALYTDFGHVVYSRCRYLLRDPDAAHDASQEVFVKVMRNLDSFRGEASPSTWILRIATNHCLNVIAAKRAKWHERFRAHVQHMESEGLLAGANPETSRVVAQVLGKLDRETQQIAIFYYVDEMTQEEIAASVGRSLPTIRKRLAKFKRVARKELGYEPESHDG